MEQQVQGQSAQPQPQQPQPQQPQPQPQMQPQPQAQAPQAAPAQKSSIWKWILGGCFGIIILGMIIFGVLTWWGAREAKKIFNNEIKPGIEDMQKNTEGWQKESEEWQKKSAEMRNSLPNPDDLKFNDNSEE